VNIGQLQYLAKKGGSKRFKVIGSVGERTGIWLDAWLGLIQFDGVDGLMMAKDFIMNSELEWFPIPEEDKEK